MTWYFFLTASSYTIQSFSINVVSSSKYVIFHDRIVLWYMISWYWLPKMTDLLIILFAEERLGIIRWKIKQMPIWLVKPTTQPWITKVYKITTTIVIHVLDYTVDIFLIKKISNKNGVAITITDRWWMRNSAYYL
jgi:hypothetical protein